MQKLKITKTVWILSFISLFTDIASEMLYPVMPVYLKSIGFSALIIGILEGFAEAAAGFSKGYFGNLSDRAGRRVPFIRYGYILSAISKPMLAVSKFSVWIFFSRGLDRLGKGIRTSARDALLSSESEPKTKGRIFAIHRGMDTLGAMLGPLAALLYLQFYPGNYTALFIIAFFPGAAAGLLTFIIKEKKSTGTASIKGTNFFSFMSYWKASTPEYKKLTSGLFFFTLINSSDVFLLLLLKHLGYSDSIVISAYIFYNFIYAAASYPAGALADKFGLKIVLIAGLVLFSIVYLGMSFHPSMPVIIILFMIYGIYAASTESISKAWITNISKKEDAATALGFYNSFASLFTMLASFTAGLLWTVFTPSAPFIFSAVSAILCAIYFKIFLPKHIT